MTENFIPKELKTLEIDIENKIFKVNGENFGSKCQYLKIECSPPEWKFKVVITRPMVFCGSYDLKGKENRTLREVRYGEKFKK